MFCFAYIDDFQGENSATELKSVHFAHVGTAQHGPWRKWVRILTPQLYHPYIWKSSRPLRMSLVAIGVHRGKQCCSLWSYVVDRSACTTVVVDT